MLIKIIFVVLLTCVVVTILVCARKSDIFHVQYILFYLNIILSLIFSAAALWFYDTQEIIVNVENRKISAKSTVKRHYKKYIIKINVEVESELTA